MFFFKLLKLHFLPPLGSLYRNGDPMAVFSLPLLCMHSHTEDRNQSLHWSRCLQSVWKYKQYISQWRHTGWQGKALSWEEAVWSWQDRLSYPCPLGTEKHESGSVDRNPYSVGEYISGATAARCAGLFKIN